MHHQLSLTPALEDLKRRLRSETDLAKLMDAFLDVAEKTDLTERSKPGRNERLEQVLKKMFEVVPLSGGTDLAVMLPAHCAEHGMYHGGLLVGRYFGTYFYFQTLDRGACAVSTIDGRVHAFRFTIANGVPVAGVGEA